GDPLDITGLAADPRDPATVYATTLGKGASLFRSRDGGTTWSSVGDGLPGEYGPIVTMLTPAPVSPGRLYAGLAYGDGIYATNGRGTHWRLLPGNLPGYVTSIVVDPRRAGTLYAGT